MKHHSQPPKTKGKEKYANKNKKRDTIASDSDREDGCASDQSDAELSFASYNMDNDDYHSIKQFFHTLFAGGAMPIKRSQLYKVDITLLTELVTEVLGEYVGTTAKSSEKEDPLAFVTMVPLCLDPQLAGYKEDHQSCLDELLDLLVASADNCTGISKKSKTSIKKVLEMPESTAVVFHERFMNLPSEIAAPLYQQLLDDLPNATEESSNFAPENVLVFAPIYRELESQLSVKDDDEDDDDNGDQKKKKRSKTSNASEKALKLQQQEASTSEAHDNQKDYQYYYNECELLENEADAFFDFKVKTPHDTADSRRAFGDRGVDPARRVFILTLDSFKSFVKQCQLLLPSSGSQ